MELLQIAGLKVRIAESGKEALLTAITFRPEIVLCDLRLPDMSGLDVAHALRANPETKNVLFAMHTAMSETDIVELQREMDSGEVNLFLSKPLSDEKIERLLAGLAALRTK